MSDGSSSIVERCQLELETGDDVMVDDNNLLRTTQQLLECTVQALEMEQEGLKQSVDTFYLIYASSLVFFMQAGFAMLCAGSVRLKNVQNTMLKNLLDACGAVLGFYTFGYSFAYGTTNVGNDATVTLIGTSHFFLRGIANLEEWLFQFAFAASAATIVAGTLAERCQMTAYLAYSFLLTGFVYPVVVHAIWSTTGFLSPAIATPVLGTGVIDFAGSGVVHLTGGITALIATYILGPRRGRFYDERGVKLQNPKTFPGHSVALQMLGAFVLWFGWYGFNSGSIVQITPKGNAQVAALAAVNTTLSAAAGGVAALFCNLIVVERLTGEATFNLNYAMNGCLSGLVAITGGCAVVEPWAAVLTGLVAGVLYLGSSNGLVSLRLDDAVDAIPVHLCNGAWGLVVVGLFASPDRLQQVYGTAEHVGWFYSLSRNSTDARLLFTQVLGIVFITGWLVAVMFPFFFCLNYMGWFRSDSLEEVVGLDISYHGTSLGPNTGGSSPGSITAQSSGEDVKSEYVEAFRRRRMETMRHRESARGGGGRYEDVLNEESSHVVDRVLPASDPA